MLQCNGSSEIEPGPVLDIEETNETHDSQLDPGFLPNDVILIVEEQIIHVNKTLLESASPVFEAWLKEEWQNNESTDGTKRELKFPGKTYKEMATFLKCLLPFFPDKVTDKSIDTVLPLADEYRAENLITECGEVIQKQVESISETDIYIPPSRVVTFLRWIEQYNLNTCKECVIRLASYLKTSELEAVPDYENVSLRLQLKVSNARATLLDNLFVFSLPEAEEKMYKYKIPLSSNYMDGWKNNLAENVEAFLTKRGNTTLQPSSTFTFGSPTVAVQRSGILVHTNSNIKPQIPTRVEGTFACISICDRFKFQESYAESIATLTSLKINKSEFKKLWSAHYSSGGDDKNNDMERHVLQMCKCT